MIIFKYELKVDDLQLISMPKGAKLLTVQAQRNIPCIWALIDPDAEKEDKKICMRGTGHNALGVKDMCYIGTFQMSGGDLVFHVFV